MAKGEIIGCFGLTEPDFGSNPSGMRTVARDDGDSFVLNGTKRWITNGNLAHVALIWAKVGGVEGEVRGFLVPTGREGVRGAPDPQEDEPARQRHERADPRGRARPEGRDAPQRARDEGAALVPHERALRDRVGGHRRGVGVLRLRGRLRQAPRAVRRASRSRRTSSCRRSSRRCSRRSPRCSCMALEVSRLKNEHKLKPSHV